MTVLLVIYEIEDDDARSIVEDRIQRSHHRKLTEFTYAIKVDSGSIRIGEYLENIYDDLCDDLWFDDDDRVYVLPFPRSFTSMGPDDTDDWLRDNP